MGFLVQLIHQTPWSEQPVRLQELQLCTQARRSCTFFCVHLNASHGEPKSFSCNLITAQVKARLAMCLLTTVRGTICCLTFYGQREPAGAPQRERQAWVSHAGAGAKGAAAAGRWKKRRFTKGDCAFPRWAAAGGSQPAARPDRGDSLR